MTLDEAIERYKDNAEYERTHGNLQGCLEFKQLVEWLKELKDYKEQDGDTISRQAAIDVANQYWYKPDIAGALAELPPAQPKQMNSSENPNNSDTIYRQAAIDIASGYCHPANIVKELERLPPAQPKTGHWVLKDLRWECNQCGCRIRRENPFRGNLWNYYYCPNCGAKMEEENGKSGCNHPVGEDKDPDHE